MTGVRLALEGVRVRLEEDVEVVAPEVDLGPGTIAHMPASFAAARALQRLMSGQGRAVLHAGTVTLGDQDLLRLTADERLFRGLHVPVPLQLAPATNPLRILISEVDRARAVLEKRPVPALAALQRTNLAALCPQPLDLHDEDDADEVTEVAQALLVEAPLVLLTLERPVTPRVLELISRLVADVRAQQRSLLVVGPGDELEGALGVHLHLSAAEEHKVLDAAV